MLKEINEKYQDGKKIPFNEYVDASKFRALADYIYKSEGELPPFTGKPYVVFCKIDETKEFLKRLRKETFQPIILITCLGDGRVYCHERRDIDVAPRRRGPQVIYWFSTNICTKQWGLESIPIGIDVNRWTHLRKHERLAQAQRKERKRNNLLYINHHVFNNPKERESPYTLFEDKLWVTSKKNKNGDDYDLYLEDILSHDFVLSPEGGGPDCHRFWEALYLGSIPVVKDHVNLNYYPNLPMVVVRSWDQISENFLNEQKKIISSRRYNFDTLRMSYWEDRVNRFRKKLFFEIVRSAQSEIVRRISGSRFQRAE